MALEDFEFDEEESEKDEDKVSIFKNQEDEDEEDLNNEHSFNLSRKEINFFISNPSKPKIIQILQIVTNSLFILIFVLGYITFFLNFNKDNALNGPMLLFRNSHLKISEFEHILKSVNDLYFLNIGIYSSSENITEQQTKKEITGYLQSVQDLQLYLSQNSDGISSELESLLSDQNIDIIFSQISSEKYGLNEATQQMISKIFNLVNSNLSSINFNNSNFFFINLNIYGDFFDSLQKASQNYFNYLLLNIEIKQSNLVTMLISGTVLIGGCIFLIVIAIKIQKINEEVLNLFLLIKEKDLRFMYSRNEAFLSFLQTGDDQDEDFYENDDENLNKSELGDYVESHRIKKKKFKKTRHTPFKLIGSLIIIGSLLEFFFLFVYFSSYTLSNNLQPILNFFNVVNQAESQFLYAFNCQQSLLINQKFLLDNTTLINKCRNSVDGIYQFQSNFNDVRFLRFIFFLILL